MARLRSDFWVAAHLRRCAGEGIDAVLRRRGSAESGAIFVSVDRLDGTGDLYGPTPQALASGDEVGRLFSPVALGIPAADIEARMAREVRFDPDLWWLAIDDRAGRSGLELQGERPDAPGGGVR